MTVLPAGTIPAEGRRRPGAAVIDRPLLVERLIESDAPLVVICAPAGYGKTTLVTQWAAADERPFAWLKPSHDDNDPEVLVDRLTRALFTAGVLDNMRLQPFAALARRSVGITRADLAVIVAVSAPVVIVLDDAEELANPVALAVLEWLVDELPMGSALALAGRVRPALGLGRLRAEDRVLEIGLPDLTLEVRDGARLVETAGLRLSAKSTAVLVERAEGWPAGLALAARSLRGRRDADLEARRFNGDERAVAQYLAEILDGLSQSCIDFLIDTSVLERFCPALCDAVRQRSDSAQIIQALETAHVFLVALDDTGDWYRYHNFFAAFLRGECRRRRGDSGAVLHARASRWWERHDDRDNAVRHAYAGGDLARFERLVWSTTPSYLTNDHVHELAAWLELPTREQVAARPSLSIASAWLTALNAEDTEALTANLAGLDDARLCDGALLRDQLALLSAVTAKRGLAQGLVDATCAYEAIDSHSPWKAFACLSLGIALRQREQALQAKAILNEGYNRSARAMPALAASCSVQLAWLAVDEGDWEQARSCAARACAALELAGPAHLGPKLAIDATSALLFARSGHTRAGHHYAYAALEGLANRGLTGVTIIEAQVMAARALVLLSEHATARRLLYQARTQASRIGEASVLSGKVAEALDIVEAAFAAAPVPDRLTPAELRVLHYLPTYMTLEEISQDLNVSRTTVKTQVVAVYRKLGVKSRAAAVQKAYQQGLLSA
jgi:LuxR family maltose regulon positive regulatory protein